MQGVHLHAGRQTVCGTGDDELAAKDQPCARDPFYGNAHGDRNDSEANANQYNNEERHDFPLFRIRSTDSIIEDIEV
jgi:hypothetical protein